MKKDYTKRLENLRKRRYDDTLQKSILSESFSKTDLGKSVKYTLEAMKAIEPSYTNNTYIASENIQKNLTTGLNRNNIFVDYRHQGSVQTNTHIKLHSDIDLLVITKRFFTVEPPNQPENPYLGEPLNDLKELRQNCFNILNSTYDQVDGSNSKSIQVFPTNPKRKVDVIPSNWYYSDDYIKYGKQEVYCGVQIYNKETHDRSVDFPFLHINKVNGKSGICNNDGLRKLIRLLKTLKADADYEIKLSSFEITSLVYDMSLETLHKPHNQQLKLLPEASIQIEKLINESSYRVNLKSPNEKEYVFGYDESKVVELKKIKLEVDELIEDIKQDLSQQFKNIETPINYV